MARRAERAIRRLRGASCGRQQRTLGDGSNGYSTKTRGCGERAPLRDRRQAAGRTRSQAQAARLRVAPGARASGSAYHRPRQGRVRLGRQRQAIPRRQLGDLERQPGLRQQGNCRRGCPAARDALVPSRTAEYFDAAGDRTRRQTGRAGAAGTRSGVLHQRWLGIQRVGHPAHAPVPSPQRLQKQDRRDRPSSRATTVRRAAPPA